MTLALEAVSSLRRRASIGGVASAGIAIIVAAAALLPIVNLVVIALEGDGTAWPHILAHVLPNTFRETVLLLAGVGLLSTAIGTGAAWLVTAYAFPGRRLLSWALLLPLAMPTYIVAYAYLDVLHPIGPVQASIRYALGFASPADLRLPDIRSLPGAAILLGFVLYPYVFLTTRALFLLQSANVAEVARSLGVGQAGIFLRLAVPLARPAIAVGVTLVLLETLNDVGASSFLGIQTITISIQSVWINQSDLPGAAQLALLLLAVVMALVGFERFARRRQVYAIPSQGPRAMEPLTLRGPLALLAQVLCLIPVAVGFLVPFFHLVNEAFNRLSFAGFSSSLSGEILNTVVLSASATGLAVAAGFAIAAARRFHRTRFTLIAARIATVGYAVPGTVLAIGMLPVQASLVGSSIGLLSLSAGGLVFAYVVRFLAISEGSVEAGLTRIPRSLDEVARSLGRSTFGMLARIHIPLTKSSIAAGAILVFVDCMKELPIALMLRPLNLETLSTHLYAEAVRGTYEDGAVAALLIVLVGLVPVVILSKMMHRPMASAQ